MPIPLAPNTSPADASGAFAILAILGDDNKFKKRLQELKDQAAEIDKMIDNSRKMEIESKNRLKEADKRHEEVEKREANLKGREDSLGQGRRETLALQEQLNARQAKFDADMEARGKVKEAGLIKWSQELTEKEKAVTSALRSLEDEKKKFDARVAAEEHKLSSYSRDISTREEHLKQGLADLAKARDEFDAKVKKLDELRRSISNAA
jgi:DNA repair exonuclease SbcCD ATPase subunit